MGNINISDLRPAGADLFLDSESYLNDLTEGEMTNTLGGRRQWSRWWCSCRCCWGWGGWKKTSLKTSGTEAKLLEADAGGVLGEIGGELLP